MEKNRLIFLLSLSFKRVLSRKKLFLLLLFSMTAALIVPLLGLTLAEALVRQKNAVCERYPETAWIYRLDSPPVGEDMLSRIRDSLCEAGVTAQLYSEYVLMKPDSTGPSGRFLDVNAADAVSVSLFYPELSPELVEAFSDNRSVCVVDDRTARLCGLSTGDILSVRGKTYEISAIIADRSGSFVCIPYGKLSPGTDCAHTFYLLFDRAETKASVLSAMNDLLPEGKNRNAVPLSQSYETRKSAADSTLLLAAAVTGLFLLVAVTNISLIRCGEMRIHLHDYAVSLVFGCTKKELLFHVLFENLLTIPPSLLLDLGLYFILVRWMPFSLSLSLFSILCVSLLAFLSACAAAGIVTRRLFRQSCVSMLREG